MSIRVRAAVAWALAALALLACDPGSPTVAPMPPELASDGGCDNAASLLEEMRGGGRGGLRGDMDGDGRVDDVLIATDQRAAIGCRGILFVITKGPAYAVGVDTEATQLQLGQPALRLLAEVDGEPGMEAIVDVQAGASTGFVSLYSLSSGKLSRVRDRGRPGPNGLFAHGGSVGHADGVDCDRSGDVITYSALAQEDHYLVRRFVLTADDGVLVANRERTKTHRVSPENLFVRWPQLAGPPFASCPQA